MILYQITNAQQREISGPMPLPIRPDVGDVAEAVGWDGHLLYEQDGQWVEPSKLKPAQAVRYAGEPAFVGKGGSGTGYHVYLVKEGPGVYRAAAVRPRIFSRDRWFDAGPLGSCELPQRALDLLMRGSQVRA